MVYYSSKTKNEYLAPILKLRSDFALLLRWREPNTNLLVIGGFRQIPVPCGAPDHSRTSTDVLEHLVRIFRVSPHFRKSSEVDSDVGSVHREAERRLSQIWNFWTCMDSDRTCNFERLVLRAPKELEARATFFEKL